MMGSECCEGGMCSRCAAGKWIVFGLLLIINKLYIMWDPWMFVGGLLILKGLLKMIKPSCGHCGTMEMKKSKR